MRSAALLLLLAAACASVPAEPENLAAVRVAPDFASYPIRRAGLVPFAGAGLDAHLSASLQRSFLVELSRFTDYEVVQLSAEDLAEVPDSEPYRRGWYQPRTIIDLSRRFSLDAMLVGTVMQMQAFPPQQLSIELDLVAAETGLVIWHSSIHLDASEARVRRALEAWFEQKSRRPDSEESVSLTLLSPTRFARFAAHQMAGGL